MSKREIKAGDQVEITGGEHKGNTGVVLRVDGGLALVDESACCEDGHHGLAFREWVDPKHLKVVGHADGGPGEGDGPEESPEGEAGYGGGRGRDADLH
jgi:hypothetical protein